MGSPRQRSGSVYHPEKPQQVVRIPPFRPGMWVVIFLEDERTRTLVQRVLEVKQLMAIMSEEMPSPRWFVALTVEHGLLLVRVPISSVVREATQEEINSVQEARNSRRVREG